VVQHVRESQAQRLSRIGALRPLLGWMVERFGARLIVPLGIGFMLLSRIEA
jgi:hypothetical protein